MRAGLSCHPLNLAQVWRLFHVQLWPLRQQAEGVQSQAEVRLPAQLRPESSSPTVHAPASAVRGSEVLAAARPISIGQAVAPRAVAAAAGWMLRAAAFPPPSLAG